MGRLTRSKTAVRWFDRYEGDCRLNGAIDLFRIRAIVPHFEASVADYRASSAETRIRLAARLNIAYGAGPDEKLDLFCPDGPAAAVPRPIHLFIHGGYWRANSKDDYSYIADAIVAEGAIAAIVDYYAWRADGEAGRANAARRALAWREWARIRRRFQCDQRERAFGGWSSGDLSVLSRSA
jgi:acetyl esterase/lipase